MSSDRPPTPPPADPTTTTPPPSGNGFHRQTDEFFDRIRGLGVTRPSDGRWGAGVAAGLARRWDIDVVLVRGVFVALALMGGLGVAAYGIAWLLIPQDDGRIHLQAALRGHVTAGLIGAVLLSLSAISGGGPGHGYWFGWGFPGGLILSALIVAGIWWYARHEIEKNGPIKDGGSPLPPVPPATTTEPVYGTPPAAATWQYVKEVREEHREEARQTQQRRALTSPSRPVTRTTLGVALLAAAIILVLGNANDWDTSVGLVAAAVALAVVGLGVVVSGFLGRRSGLAFLGVLLAIGTLGGVAAEDAGVDSGQNLTAVGERTWRPTTAVAAAKQFNLGVGEATLNLTDPGILAGSGVVDVQVRTGVGHLTVVLPDGVASRVDLRLSAGELTRPDGTTTEMKPNSGNHRQTLVSGPGGEPELVVDVRHGVGELDITTASRYAATTGNAVAPAPTASPSATPSATATPTPTTTN